MKFSNKDYDKVKEIYSLNRNTYKQRKEKIDFNAFTKINWSDAYLDFAPFNSIFNQLKKIRIYDEEKPSTIKNHFIDDKLIYAVHSENYLWGSVFIDYHKDYNIWLLFSENIDEEVDVRQVKINYFDNGRLSKSVFYGFDDDDDDEIEETFMVYNYEYDMEDNLVRVIRNGFYQNIEKILPPIIFSFEYEGNKMKIMATQEKFEGDPSPTSVIYNGKIILPNV